MRFLFVLWFRYFEVFLIPRTFLGCICLICSHGFLELLKFDQLMKKNEGKNQWPLSNKNNSQSIDDNLSLLYILYTNK